MITYNPAFDLYHCIFRLAHIIQRMGLEESFEVDKVRIWDFYLLYPSKLYDLSLHRHEKEIREARRRYVDRSKSPYEYRGDNRRLFDWIRPFQVSALNCLVSCGILSKEAYMHGQVAIADQTALDAFVAQTGGCSDREHNILSFLSLFSRQMSLSGHDGLKARTRLLESKYDAE